MDYKEYTRMRDIAQKRIKRAQAAGKGLEWNIPTVKELRKSGEYVSQIWFAQLSQFVSTGPSLSREREKNRKPLTPEQKREKRREYQYWNRRQRVAREHERVDYPKKYQSYVTALRKLEVDIPPSKLPAFFQYLDYRFAQGKDSKQYVIDLFVADYKEMLRKGYNPNQILSDFQKFEANQAGVEERSNHMIGMSYEKAADLWSAFKTMRD